MTSHISAYVKDHMYICVRLVSDVQNIIFLVFAVYTQFRFVVQLDLYFSLIYYHSVCSVACELQYANLCFFFT